MRNKFGELIELNKFWELIDIELNKFGKLIDIELSKVGDLIELKKFGELDWLIDLIDCKIDELCCS